MCNNILGHLWGYVNGRAPRGPWVSSERRDKRKRIQSAPLYILTNYQDLDSHFVDFLILSLAPSKGANSALPSRTRFSLADRTSSCQDGDGTDSGLRQRSSHNRSIAASLSSVVILSSGKTNSISICPLTMFSALFCKLLYPSQICNPSFS